jgi:hypothetical protein
MTSSADTDSRRVFLLRAVIDLSPDLLDEAIVNIRSLPEKRKQETEKKRKQEEKEIKFERKRARLRAKEKIEEDFIEQKQKEVDALGLPFGVAVFSKGVSLCTYEYIPDRDDDDIDDMMGWFENRVPIIDADPCGSFELEFDIHSENFIADLQSLVSELKDERLLATLTGGKNRKE